MAFLNLELKTEKDEWINFGKRNPGEPQGSISDNKPNGSRDIYLFGCAADGSKSTIYRSKAGVDVETALSTRQVFTNNLEIVKELGLGESFILEIKTDKSPKPAYIRFTHKY